MSFKRTSTHTLFDSFFGTNNLLSSSVASQPSSSPLSVVLGGDATAVGTDTYASGNVISTTTGTGGATIVNGTATFTATAQSPQGETAYASATSFADVDGADFVFTFTKNSSASGDGYWTETSTTRVIAIDCPAFDLPGGPMVINSSVDLPPLALASHSSISGNLATLDVIAEAYGNNTYVATDASVLTVEDQLSAVSAVVVSEIA